MENLFEDVKFAQPATIVKKTVKTPKVSKLDIKKPFSEYTPKSLITPQKTSQKDYIL